MVNKSKPRNGLEFDHNDGQSINPRDFFSSSANSTSKLRLCYISNPNLIHTRRWVTWFYQHGHSVCLLADVPLKEPWSEVPVIDLSKIFYARYIRFPIWTLWMRRFIGQWRPDILHAHRINSGGWMAAASGFHPYIVTPWGLDIFVQPQQSWLARLLARYTLSHSDLITTISDKMANQAIKLGASAEKLRSVQFGVELDIFKPEPSTNPELHNLRKNLSIPDNAPVVFCPRAVTPIYNLDIVMKSIPIVRNMFPDAIFIFIDYNTEAEYKNRLDVLSMDLGINNCLRWLPPTRSRRQMAEYYRLSDIVVSVPSTDGGTPISLLEAMACGKPIVCTNLPQVGEFISDGEDGLLVPVREVSPLAEAISRLLEQPDEAANYGQKALEVVSQKANSEVEMERMEGIYYQLAASTRR